MNNWTWYQREIEKIEKWESEKWGKDIKRKWKSELVRKWENYENFENETCLKRESWKVRKMLDEKKIRKCENNKWENEKMRARENKKINSRKSEIEWEQMEKYE